MSTQDGNGIALELLAERDQRHFRLLELPAELLTLLTSDQPPVLELKASEGQDEANAGHVSLCTQDKTFDLRQKNSSNTVYLIEPKAGPDDPGITLEVISQLHSSLELTASKAKEFDVLVQIRAVLPVFGSSGAIGSHVLTKEGLVDQVPYSEQQCLNAMQHLAAFVHPESGSVFRPSAAVALQTWQAILVDAVAEGVDLDQLITTDGSKSLRSDEIAVQSRIADAIIAIPAGNIDRLVTWIGQTLLEAEAAQTEVPIKTFVARWQDLLPEKWRSMADISKLTSVLRSSDDGKAVRWNAAVFDIAASKGQSGIVGGVKRKWHEKFRPSKR